MSLADQAEGRVIHAVIDVTITPPQGGPLGKTDAGAEIAKGLIREVALLLKNTCEAEGFVVKIEARTTVY